ncbi:MAG TPA: hypothetical protein DDW53_02455 [Lachnoclostridium sp.]|nr:hypothetical protein [Lachnoclostridium sp.]
MIIEEGPGKNNAGFETVRFSLEFCWNPEKNILTQETLFVILHIEQIKQCFYITEKKEELL